MNTFLSKFLPAYRKSYSTNHVLVRLIENWKKPLGEKKYASAVLMNLLKAFASIPHDLLIAKMYVYRFSINSVTFFYSYLKRRKQNFGPLLFNIFINGLYLWITKTELLNLADDNTITTAERTFENLLSTLETECQAAIEWFKLNEMIVNPEKVPAIVVKKKKAKMKDSYPLNINDLTINSENRVKLLDIEIDKKLSCEQHISALCNKASNQLNAIGRIQKFMGFKEKEVLLNSFVYSNFNYCPLIWHFYSSKFLYKIKKIQELALRLLHNNFARDYAKLLKKSGMATMEIKHLQCLAPEIFKTVNNVNPYYMK